MVLMSAALLHIMADWPEAKQNLEFELITIEMCFRSAVFNPSVVVV